METARKLIGGDLDVFIENEVPRTQSWLYDTIQGFVNDECDVLVESAASDSGAVFTVRVAPGEMGKVIGKQGRMARTLRTLLLARGGKLGIIYTLNIEPIAPAAEEYSKRMHAAVLPEVFGQAS